MRSWPPAVPGGGPATTTQGFVFRQFSVFRSVHDQVSRNG
jgi:hypothetical protein